MCMRMRAVAMPLCLCLRETRLRHTRIGRAILTPTLTPTLTLLRHTRIGLPPNPNPHL